MTQVCQYWKKKVSSSDIFFYLGVVFADALGSSQVNVNGAAVFRAVIGSAYYQVLYSFGVFLSSAIQVNVASTGHSQTESRFVILALQSIELLKGMLNIGEKFSDLKLNF